jgi:hypothetical protein
VQSPQTRAASSAVGAVTCPDEALAKRRNPTGTDFIHLQPQRVYGRPKARGSTKRIAKRRSTTIADGILSEIHYLEVRIRAQRVREKLCARRIDVSRAHSKVEQGGITRQKRCVCPHLGFINALVAHIEAKKLAGVHFEGQRKAPDLQVIQVDVPF